VSIGKQVEWYKRMNLYVVYADAFRNGKRGDFFSLAKNLEYIKDTGFDAIHVLPFLESPMQDAGFDVSDFFKVRKRLGGNEGF
jgi:maltose alpha-D-glucosyltransferase/alpha-amylase